jgi:putative peptidoglycan lipid II flippase
VSALKLLLVCLSVVAVVGVIMAAPTIIQLVAPGFSDSPEKMALTITLTRIMFPYVILIGLVALCMGILNVLGHFAAPAIAPVLLNLAMIGSVFAISRLLGFRNGSSHGTSRWRAVGRGIATDAASALSG